MIYSTRSLDTQLSNLAKFIDFILSDAKYQNKHARGMLEKNKGNSVPYKQSSN